jgi:hypothetical protein
MATAGGRGPNPALPQLFGNGRFRRRSSERSSASAPCDARGAFGLSGEWRAQASHMAAPIRTLRIPKAGRRRGRAPTRLNGTLEFFLIQDERATTDGKPFNRMGYIGVDPTTGTLHRASKPRLRTPV